MEFIQAKGLEKIKKCDWTCLSILECDEDLEMYQMIRKTEKINKNVYLLLAKNIWFCFTLTSDTHVLWTLHEFGRAAKPQTPLTLH